jgi:hypothetical protein
MKEKHGGSRILALKDKGPVPVLRPGFRIGNTVWLETVDFVLVSK